MSDDKDYKARLELAVNDARGAMSSLSQQRRAAAYGNMGIGSGMGIDSKRPMAWCEYGFPQDVDFPMLYSVYRRTALAHGAVNKLVQTTWKNRPWVIEGEADDNDRSETPWEVKLKPLLRSMKLWDAFAKADMMRLVGRFSGILLQFADNKTWDQPVGGAARLVKAIPAWAGCLKITEWDTDEKSQTFGDPKFWQYIEGAVGNVKAGREVKVHPDRIFILGDYSVDAIGFLEPAFNNMVSLEKIEGGAGESYLKNAARQIALSFDPSVQLLQIAKARGVELKDLKEVMQESARDLNSMSDAMMITQGAEAKILTATVPDPTPAWTINAQSASAAWDIPTKILIGMQTGERASTEDQKYMNSRCESRRENEISPEVTALLEKLMAKGAVPLIGTFTVMWAALNEASSAEKLANAKVMADINATNAAQGIQLFSGNEIREEAGHEPEEGLDELEETSPEDTDVDPDAEDEEDTAVPPKAAA